MIVQIDNHQKAYACVHVFENSRPVLLVSRPEGDWCFLCGSAHDNDVSAYRVVGIGHVFDADATLFELADLASNWEAEREAVDGEWICTPIPDEADLQ